MVQKENRGYLVWLKGGNSHISALFPHIYHVGLLTVSVYLCTTYTVLSVQLLQGGENFFGG